VDKLRLPFFLGAVACSVLVVLIEVGAGAAEGFLAGQDPPGESPGLAIAYLALLDGQLLLTMLLMAASLVVPKDTHAKVQGCLTLIVALLLILGAIVLAVLAFALLLLMIALITSFFGAIVYAALFGSFPKAGAAVTLGLLLLLKLVGGVLLVLAHQRFLQNKGLVALIVTSLVANVVVSILHGLVPGFLVSITDAVAAIIVAIVAAIWAVLLLIGAVVGVLRVIQPPKLPEMPGQASTSTRQVPSETQTRVTSAS
jgi:hypothetical protein